MKKAHLSIVAFLLCLTELFGISSSRCIYSIAAASDIEEKYESKLNANEDGNDIDYTLDHRPPLSPPELPPRPTTYLNQAHQQMDSQNIENPKNKVDHFLENMRRYQRIALELKEEFVGYEKLIDELMATVQLIEQRPQLVQKPIVIPLLSFPGYGKTTIIQAFLKKMGWDEVRFRQFGLEKNANSLPTKEILSFGEDEESADKPGIQGVVLFDEIGHLRRQSDLDKEAEEWSASQKKIEEAASSQIYKGGEEKGTSGSSQGKESDVGADDALKILKGQYITFNGKVPGKYIREKDLKNLWQILGNGTLVEQPENSPDDYIRFFSALIGKADEIYQKKIAVTNYQRELQSKRQEMRKLEAETAAGRPISVERYSQLKSDVNSLEETWKSPLAEAKRDLEKFNRIANTVRMAILQIKDEYPELLGKYSDLNLNDIENEYFKDPLALIKELKSHKDRVRLDRKRYFRRMIFFITGNPEELIEEVKKNFEHLSESEIDPDVLKDKTLEIVTAEAIKKWFRNIFGGSDSALESRFNLGNWNIILPFGSVEWRKLTQCALNKYSKQFQLGLKALELQKIPQLFFDSSAEDLVYYEGISPMHGPRALFDTANKLLGSFIVNLTARVIESNGMLERAQREGIYVSFDQVNSELIAKVGNQNNIEDQLLVMPIQLLKQPGFVNHSDRSLVQRQAIHQAGYALAGMMILKSAPNYLELRAYETANELRKLWDTYQVETYQQEKAVLYTLLGAVAAELKYLPQTMVSAKIKSGSYRTRAIEIARKIKESLDTVRKTKVSLGYQKYKVPLDMILPKEIAKDPFFLLLDEADESLDEKQRMAKLDHAVGLALQEVENLIANNERTISALANELLKSETKGLSGEKIREIMKLNFQKKVRYPRLTLVQYIRNLFPKKIETIRKQLKENEPGLTNLNPCPVLNIPYRTVPKRSGLAQFLICGD